MGSKGNKLINKGRYALKFRGVACLNCDHPLDVSDKFCPNCSQANSTKKLVLKDFFDEFLSSIVNYDSKLLKTLYTMLLRPGTITKDYISGKRVSYTNPFRFLLSLAFIYFLIFSYDNSFSNLDKISEQFDEKMDRTGPVSFSLKDGSIAVDSADIKRQIDDVDQLGDSLLHQKILPKNAVDQLDSVISKKQIKEIDTDSLILHDPKGFFKKLNKGSSTSVFFEKMNYFMILIRHDSIQSIDQAILKYEVPDNDINNLAFKFSSSVLRAWNKPSAFINATLSRMPFVIFFFLPLFTVFIWLVYIRKKYTYTDHLIFSFHNQSLLFILLIISLLIDAVFNTASEGLFVFVFALYLYKSMRNFYGQGRFKTIVKYIFLNTIFTILAVLAVILVFTGSFVTY